MTKTELRLRHTSSCTVLIIVFSLAGTLAFTPSASHAEVAISGTAEAGVLGTMARLERERRAREEQRDIPFGEPEGTNFVFGNPEGTSILDSGNSLNIGASGQEQSAEPTFYVTPYGSIGTRDFNRTFLISEPTPGQPEPAFRNEIEAAYYTGGISFGGCLPGGQTLYDYGPNCFHGGLSYTQGEAEEYLGVQQFLNGLGVPGPSATERGLFYAGAVDLQNGRYSYEEERFALELGKSWPGLTVGEAYALTFLFGQGIRFGSTDIEETLTGTLDDGTNRVDFMSMTDVDMTVYGAFLEAHLLWSFFSDAALGTGYFRTGGRVGLNYTQISGYDLLQGGGINDRQNFDDSAWHGSGRAEAAVGINLNNGFSLELLGRAAFGENLSYSIDRPYLDPNNGFAILPTVVGLDSAGNSTEYTGMFRATFKF